VDQNNKKKIESKNYLQLFRAKIVKMVFYTAFNRGVQPPDKQIVGNQVVNKW
jgi:hypothetical protein